MSCDYESLPPSTTVYLLWTYEYCELCEETHQGIHATDVHLTAVFLAHSAALAYLVGAPNYITDHAMWFWKIEAWVPNPEWRAVEGELGLSTFWWYSRDGQPLPECPNFAQTGVCQ